MYKEGMGLGREYVQAREWFHKVAAQGHVNAQFLLGMMYAAGQGVTPNKNQAAEWFQKAAKQGHAEA
jgi:hypothetical protein